MKGAFKSREECLREAAEYDRLARLARLKSSRKVLTLSASYWRKRAQDAAECAERFKVHAFIEFSMPSLTPRCTGKTGVGYTGQGPTMARG